MVHRAPSYRAARWFFRDFVVRYRWRLTVITLIGLAAASLQGGALAGLNLVVAGSVDESRTLPYLGISFAASEDAAAIAALVILALGVAAILSFMQGHAVLRLWRVYQLHAVESLVDAVRRASARGAVDKASMREARVGEALRQSHNLGALTRLVAGSIAPALRFLVFSGVAVALNPNLTIVLLLVAVPSAGLTLLLFARGASRSARRVADLGRDAARELDQRLDAALQAQGVGGGARQAPGNSPFVARMDSLIRRLLLVEQAKLATAGMAIVASAVYMLYAGYQGTLQEVNWSQSFIYLVALLLAFSQLINVASSVSGLGRFYPAVALQKDTLELLEEATSVEHFRQMSKERGLQNVRLSVDEEAMG
jgi:hypothetical protein